MVIIRNILTIEGITNAEVIRAIMVIKTNWTTIIVIIETNSSIAFVIEKTVLILTITIAALIKVVISI